MDGRPRGPREPLRGPRPAGSVPGDADTGPGLPGGRLDAAPTARQDYCDGAAREGKRRSGRADGPLRVPGAGRRPGRSPSSGPRRDRLDFLPLRKAAGRLLRIDELVIERDLEDPARALDELDLGTVDPGEPVAHTERFGFISSSAAVFDPELHRLSPAVPPAPGASIPPGRSPGHLAELRVNAKTSPLPAGDRDEIASMPEARVRRWTPGRRRTRRAAPDRAAGSRLGLRDFANRHENG